MQRPAVPDTGPEAANRDSLSARTMELSQPMRHVSASMAPTADAPRSPCCSAPHPLKTPLPCAPCSSPALAANSPKLPTRRPSSSASPHRPPSSPRLMRKSSRSSMGGGATPDDHDYRPSPKRSISNLISGFREAQSTMEAIEEPVPLTAAQIAAAHFTKELRGHADAGSDAETIVVLHDACYGHRWSRLKTPKSQLSLIVERPERIHAAILGASTAYVRLGGHHANAKHAPHPNRMEATHPPFRIQRSARSLDITSSCVTNVHGTAWMTELQGMCDTATEKLAAGTKEVGRNQIPGGPAKRQLHAGDLYLAPGSLDAFQGALGGVADAIDTVFSTATRTKRAFVAVRPPGHHCSADHPSGFCWLNNVHVGIEYAAQTYGLTHAAILDFDLHHGDGSQAITWQRNDKNYQKRLAAKPNSRLKLHPDVGYYSLHDINSYPCEMGDAEKVQAASLCIENAHNQSIWNVHLQPWAVESEFWALYEERYRILLDKAKVFLQHHAARIRNEGKVQPKTAIFISAGFDASEHEGAGMQRHKVSVPTGFYARFTEDVVKLAQDMDGCEGRVISVLEGGYSDRALCSGVLSHLSGLCASQAPVRTHVLDPLMDLSERMNGLRVDGYATKDDELRYDSDWWSVANLTALERKVNPPPPPQAKKLRTGPHQPTYATPTESFAYKVVDAERFARSISGTAREAAISTRPPTPPPPEVDWVVATQELSYLLIPADRQTRSCTVEDLAGPKKEKQPVIALESMPKTRQLRERRAKTPAYAESAHSDESASVRAVSRTESRSSRRETIASLPSDEFARRASRRLSAGSAFDVTNGSTVSEDAPPVPAIPAKTAIRRLPAAPASLVRNMKVSAPSSSAAPAKTIGDMDKLTSGMKKVTLRVSGTKEEHDRKQKAQLDADRRARALKGAETRRVNAAAKKAAQASAAEQVARAKATTMESHAAEPAAAATAAPAVSSMPAESILVQNPEPEPVELPAAVPPSLPSASQDKEHEQTAARVQSIQMDPHDMEAATSLQPSEDAMFVSRSGTLSIEVPASLNVPAENVSFPGHANHDGGLTPPATTPALAPVTQRVVREPDSKALWSGPRVQNAPAATPSNLWIKPESNGTRPHQVTPDIQVPHPPWTPRPAQPGDLPNTGPERHGLSPPQPSATTEHGIYHVPDAPAK